MKALSILQPWASLVVLGHKRVETRSWNTKYRGPLLIHASANNRDKVARKLASTEPFEKCLGQPFSDLPFGKIIGAVDLVDTMRFGYDKSKQYLKSLHYEEQLQEVSFGDWSEGRYGWVFKNPKPLVPEEAKGSLSLWDWQGRLSSKYHAQTYLVDGYSIEIILEA